MFINRFMKLFCVLRDFELFILVIPVLNQSMTESDRPPLVELLMGQRRFYLPKCVFLELTSEFS